MVHDNGATRGTTGLEGVERDIKCGRACVGHTIDTKVLDFDGPIGIESQSSSACIVNANIEGVFYEIGIARRQTRHTAASQRKDCIGCPQLDVGGSSQAG